MRECGRGSSEQRGQIKHLNLTEVSGTLQSMSALLELKENTLTINLKGEQFN